jgi:hypothetical protein
LGTVLPTVWVLYCQLFGYCTANCLGTVLLTVWVLYCQLFIVLNSLMNKRHCTDVVVSLPSAVFIRLKLTLSCEFPSLRWIPQPILNF